MNKLFEAAFDGFYRSLSLDALSSVLLVSSNAFSTATNSMSPPSSSLPPLNLTSSSSTSTYPSSSPSPSKPLMISLFNHELSLSELCMIFLPILSYWLYSTILYVVSALEWTSVELHRIPTNQPRRPRNRVTVRKVLWTVAFQHVVQAVVAFVVVVYTRPADFENWRMESWWLVLGKFWVATIILDTYQYWMHRWMHMNHWLYRNFHSVHHQLTTPYAYGALYNHPIEGLLMDTVGGALPSLLLDMHPWTSCIFYCIATLKTVDDHCGYAWPWSPFKLLGRNDAEYHDIHHWGKGIKYNFSQPFYTFWDRIMGTEYEGAMKRKAEQEAAAAAALAVPAASAPVVEKVPVKVVGGKEMEVLRRRGAAASAAVRLRQRRAEAAASRHP
ncbi:hypothetical protein HDU67_005916 [Dinochytrium kinnereticum]|nr:hypothetical protein HDU67_005916 [Dinochytrium kinnereticum]